MLYCAHVKMCVGVCFYSVCVWVFCARARLCLCVGESMYL